MNVTINAVVISSADRGFVDCHRTNVSNRPAAFVMEIEDYEGSAGALKTKLIPEITPGIVSQAD